MLFLASGYLSNAAKGWIANFVETRPPFRIRFWEMPQVRRCWRGTWTVAFNHNVQTSSLRRVSEIFTASAKLDDALWFGRSTPEDVDPPPDWDPDVVARMRAAQDRVKDEHGVEWLVGHTESNFAWGILSGKVSALRWVLGMEWDMLDS